MKKPLIIQQKAFEIEIELKYQLALGVIDFSSVIKGDNRLPNRYLPMLENLKNDLPLAVAGTFGNNDTLPTSAELVVLVRFVEDNRKRISYKISSIKDKNTNEAVNHYFEWLIAGLIGGDSQIYFVVSKVKEMQQNGN